MLNVFAGVDVADYKLDMEVLSAREWLARVPAEHFERSTRLEFFQLILVTEGLFGHTVDFDLLSTAKGSLLAMRPGQVQRFVANTAWDGWAVLFEPETLPAINPAVRSTPALPVQALPAQLALDPANFEASGSALEQIYKDARMLPHGPQVRALAHAQLNALLLRLQLANDQQAPANGETTQARHYKKFRDAIELHLHEWHQTSIYAEALALSEKTLNRATRAVTGQSAKNCLSQRIALEAKRLLAHTAWPISQVADHLGFDEPSNFIKFFRREVGCAPGVFKKRWAGGARETSNSILGRPV